MKRNLKLMLALGLVALLSGCRTVDFSMPSGFSHGARKDLIRMKFAEPQSNVQLSASQKSALLELPKTTMISNKRFVVLSGSKGELTGTENYDFEIRPYADLTQVSSQRYHGYGCIIKLDVRLNDKTAGAYEDGFVIKDGFALEKTNNRIGSSGYTMDWNLVFSKAYFKALKQMNAKIRTVVTIPQGSPIIMYSPRVISTPLDESNAIICTGRICPPMGDAQLKIFVTHNTTKTRAL